MEKRVLVWFSKNYSLQELLKITQKPLPTKILTEKYKKSKTYIEKYIKN